MILKEITTVVLLFDEYNTLMRAMPYAIGLMVDWQ